MRNAAPALLSMRLIYISLSSSTEGVTSYFGKNNSQ